MTPPVEAPPVTGAPAAVPVRDAATLLLAHDGPSGLEVLLLRRTATAVFVPGAYVFPGGAVDPSDHEAAAAGLAVGRPGDAASAQVGLDRSGLAVWVAAVRECFEETGVLLAAAAGDGVPFDPGADPGLAAALAVARRAVHAGHQAFAGWLHGLDLAVPADRIHFLARWITPPGNPRRFDARFLVAAAPPGQRAEPDGFELDDALWITPAAALARHRAGTLELVLPTSSTLEAVAPFRSVAGLLAAVTAGALADGSHAMVDAGPYGVTPVRPLLTGVPAAVSPLVRRIVAPNPGVMTGPGTNTYLVGVDEVAVIDPGVTDEAHIDAILGCGGDRIRWILCTHTHKDHATGAAEVAAATGAPVLSFASRDGLTADRQLVDGDRIEGSEFDLVAVHTPGHASNHLCFLLEQERTMFSGDHVMQGSTVVINPPDGDMAAYLASLERLQAWRPALRRIAPGHGQVIDEPADALAELIAHRRDREAQVLAAVGGGEAAIEGIVAQLYPGLIDELVPRARQSVHAHLRKLTAEGRVTATDADDESGAWLPA